MSNIFSVITVVKDNPQGLEITLQSIFGQSIFIEYSERCPVQSIIIDGASKFSINPICKQFPNIAYIISEKDTGIYNAMNKGLLYANGDWTLFLNSGDVFADNTVLMKLDRYFQLLSSDKSIVCAPTVELIQQKSIVRQTKSIDKMPMHMPACHQSICVKTSVLKQYPFNEKYRICGDLEQMARMLINQLGISYCLFSVAQIDGIGLSNKLWKIAIYERKVVQKTFYPTKIHFWALLFYHQKVRIKKIIRMFMPLSLQLFIRSLLAKQKCDQ